MIENTPAGAGEARRPATLTAEQRLDLAELLAPFLRGTYRTPPAEHTPMDLLVDARPLDVLDGLHDAGVLVYDDTADRAHLRASWAAMSTALVHLAEQRRLSPDVLAAVPKSHQVYLMGHEARGEHLAETWRRQLGARNLAEKILKRGTPPTPAKIGEIVAELGGDNPYADSARPEGADPWWGCWTAEPDAVAPDFDWDRYERTIDPDAALSGLGDLCAFLGGSWEDTPGSGSITALILHLIVKAQATPAKFAAVERAFPREVTAWRAWMRLSTRPGPTARQLHAALTGQPAVAVHEGSDGAAAGQLARPAAEYAGDDETLPARIEARAMIYLGGPLSLINRDGAPLINRGKLPADLSNLIPAAARAYALPWPAGTRAVYHPVDGVTFEHAGADAPVISRTLFVVFGTGDDADRFPVGTVRRIETHEKRRGRSWWSCRHCNLGAVGATSVETEKAECLGHEAICPDQDRIDASVPRTATRPRSAVSPGDPDWVDGFGPVPGASLGNLGEDPR